MADRQTLTIDVVSDVVCPWCYPRPEAARQVRSPPRPMSMSSVSWRPFQLDPTIPPQGMDRKAYMLAKFGDEERLRDAHARLEALGEAEGIDFAFDAIKVSPNTLDAHRVIRWAGADSPDVQNKLVRRLFQLYFERGAEYRRPYGAGRGRGGGRHGRGGGREPARQRRRPRCCGQRSRDRFAHGHHRRAVLPVRRQIRCHGRAGCFDANRRHPPDRRGQGAR